MFLEIEGDALVNLELVERVVFLRARQLCILYIAGLSFESALAYKYFTQNPTCIVHADPAKKGTQ